MGAQTGRFDGLLTSPSNKHHYDHISIELLAFHVKYISGEFTLTDHDIVEWVTPEELLNYDLAEADMPIAEHLVLKDDFTRGMVKP